MFWIILFVYFLCLTFMIRIMHTKTTFDSWNTILVSHWLNHDAEIARHLHEASNEDKANYLITNRLRVEMFGKTTTDMMHLGYDIWAAKIHGIRKVKQQFEHLI